MEWTEKNKNSCKKSKLIQHWEWNFHCTQFKECRITEMVSEFICMFALRAEGWQQLKQGGRSDPRTSGCQQVVGTGVYRDPLSSPKERHVRSLMRACVTLVITTIARYMYGKYVRSYIYTLKSMFPRTVAKIRSLKGSVFCDTLLQAGGGRHSSPGWTIVCFMSYCRSLLAF